MRYRINQLETKMLLDGEDWHGLQITTWCIDSLLFPIIMGQRCSRCELHYNITRCFQGFYHVNAYGDVGVPCATALKNAGMKESFLPQTCENFCLCRYRWGQLWEKKWRKLVWRILKYWISRIGFRESVRYAASEGKLTAYLSEINNFKKWKPKWLIDPSKPVALWI